MSCLPCLFIQLIWPRVASEKCRNTSRISERIFYGTQKLSAGQGGHADDDNYKNNGDPNRPGRPVAFILAPLSQEGRKLDVWLVKRRDVKNGRWLSVPWNVAEYMGGVVCREGGKIVPSDPRTYTVSAGWRVEYWELSIKFGEGVVCDGSTHHGGHIGPEEGELNALHFLVDRPVKAK